MDFLVIVLLRVAFGTTSRKRRAVVEVLVQIGPVSAHLCRSDGATERERERENKALVSVREREREKEKKKKRVERERERERENATTTTITDEKQRSRKTHVYNLALFLGDDDGRRFRRRRRRRGRRRRFLLGQRESVFDVFSRRRTQSRGDRAGHAHAVDHSHRERYARDAAEKNPRSLHHFIGVVRVMFVCARPPSARCNFFSEVFVQNVFRVACCV